MGNFIAGAFEYLDVLQDVKRLKVLYRKEYDMSQELDLVLEGFKAEFLLLVQEERFDEADEIYQKYKAVKEANESQMESLASKASP